MAAAYGQPRLQKNLSSVMEIPSVMAMESSPAHMYILSDSEGMVVFRTYADSLQWLYSSSGMEQRGNTLTTDIRFAYLFGHNRRITVLEPTSVLGVYSSALLPEKPRDAKRMGPYLYVALGSEGLGRLSLESPASVDSAVAYILPEKLNDEPVVDLETAGDQLFVLSDENKLYIFERADEGIALSREFSSLQNINRIFLVKQTVMGSDEEGNIYEIDNSGSLSRLGSIGERVNKIMQWNDWILIRGSSNRVWTSYRNRAPVLWKEDPDAGNYFTISKNKLWMSEYNKITEIIEQSDSRQQVEASAEDSLLKVLPVDDQIIPFPNPLLLSLETAGNFPSDKVQYSYESDVNNAQIRGHGFYWQPQPEQTGMHRFKIIASSADGQTDSTSFSVEVRSFNAPPKFTPIRPISIPTGEKFTLRFKALDPDGMNQDLVRYLGVDLPEGATVDEKTGEFAWTPMERHTGENKFRIIATDQFGAATSTEVTLTVVNTSRQGGN